MNWEERSAGKVALGALGVNIMANKYWRDPDPAWDWLDRIAVGDILVSASGAERVVRGVTYRKSGLLHGVSFAIRKCSWTKRCHTTRSRNGLKTEKFSHSGRRVQKAELIDKLIAHDIKYYLKEQQRLDCCDVKGVL